MTHLAEMGAEDVLVFTGDSVLSRSCPTGTIWGRGSQLLRLPVEREL